MITPYRKTAKTPDDYETNLWLAVEDIWTEMYVSYDMNPPEIRSRILEMVQGYCEEMRDYALKDLHGMTAQKRRKLR